MYLRFPCRIRTRFLSVSAYLDAFSKKRSGESLNWNNSFDVEFSTGIDVRINIHSNIVSESAIRIIDRLRRNILIPR